MGENDVIKFRAGKANIQLALSGKTTPKKVKFSVRFFSITPGLFD